MNYFSKIETQQKFVNITQTTCIESIWMWNVWNWKWTRKLLCSLMIERSQKKIRRETIYSEDKPVAQPAQTFEMGQIIWLWASNSIWFGTPPLKARNNEVCKKVFGGHFPLVTFMR